jgi:hypothetical protein
MAALELGCLWDRVLMCSILVVVRSSLAWPAIDPTSPTFPKNTFLSLEFAASFPKNPQNYKKTQNIK